jgi:hypothetical protein
MSLLNHGLPPCISAYNQTAQNIVTAQFAGTKEALMARQSRSKRTKVRDNLPKAQFPAGLAAIVSETVRRWRKHHLGYDQTKYIVEQARRRLKLQPVGTRLMFMASIVGRKWERPFPLHVFMATCTRRGLLKEWPAYSKTTIG